MGRVLAVHRVVPLVSRAEQHRGQVTPANHRAGGNLRSRDGGQSREPIEIGDGLLDHGARVDPTRPDHRCRHPDRPIPHVGTLAVRDVRCRRRIARQHVMPVALVPDAAMTHAVAVIARVDDHRRLGQSQVVELREQQSDVAVHALGAGQVLARHALHALDMEVRKVRIRNDRIQALERCPVLGGDRQPARVRGAVVQGERERSLPLALQECQRLRSQDVRGQALELPLLAVLLQHGIGGRRPSGAESHEVLVTVAGRVVLVEQPKVPFSDQPGSIARRLQHFGPSDDALVEAVEGFAPGIEPIRESEFAAVPTRDQARPRGCANGRDSEGVRQVRSAPEELVHVRRGGMRMARQTQRPAGLVIGEYEQDVGLLGGPSDYR